MTGISGRVALVTGSSRNIGRAIVLAFAGAGADVVVNARTSRDEAEDVARAAREHGVRAMACTADVRDAGAVGRMVADARAELGPVDILVNCAAVRPERPFEEIPPEEWREVLSTVLDGAYTCTGAVIRGMVERGRGAIINVIGLTGETGAVHRAHVVTAKAGLIGLTKALALEYAARGVTVNGVSPGFIATERRATSAVAQPAHRRDRTTPVGREGRPEDVAACCCYLASDEARFITGQIISINGGVYL